jgi:transglutaminase-like putative cysteine protease
MSQANWTEFVAAPPLAERRDGWPESLRWLLDWESWLTLALVMIVFLSVARSIDGAAWVPEMPSITGVAFLAILAGFVISRLRGPEGLLHLAALALGVPVILALIVGFIQPPTFAVGLQEVWERWGAWIEVVRGGGISSDTMPFVTLVLALTWIAGYLAAWSIFRWRNAWVALVPGGIGLLTNISYLPAQFSFDFVVFLFGGMLLVMRVHLLRKIDEWKRTNTPYPDLISLTFLNVTTWVAVIAILLAWKAPQANEVPFLRSGWNAISGPFSADSDFFTRLFSGIDAKKEVPLHNFGETLPLQGKVVLSGRIVAQADFGEATNQGRPLRAAVYDEYISGGWRSGPRTEAQLGPNEGVTSQPLQAQRQTPYRDRQEIEVTVVTESGTPRRTLVNVGVPSDVNIASRSEIIAADPPPDVAALRARRDLKTGDTYVTKGTISTASEEKLRAASTDYPQYIRDRYLQLPQTLPQRVRNQATTLTRDKATPFDKAKEIESFLRTYPGTWDLRAAPPNRDAVDWFLFEERKGYPDYQASAMVVMLRSVGVPARLAVGYTVDEFDLSVKRFLLREKHAYAWPEVYFPGYGWVEFAPYGEAPMVARPISDNGNGDAAETDPSLLGEGIMPEIDAPFDDTGLAGAYIPPESSFLDWLLPLLYVLGGLAALAGMGALGFRLVWERGLGGLDYPSQLWEKTVRLATWLRFAPAPSQTPSEYSRALQRHLPGTEGVDRVADSYLRSRYGGQREVQASERDELQQAWTPLRNRMMKKLFRLK